MLAHLECKSRDHGDFTIINLSWAQSISYKPTHPQRQLLLPIKHSLRLHIERLGLRQQLYSRLPFLLLRLRQRPWGRHAFSRLAREFETREQWVCETTPGEGGETVVIRLVCQVQYSRILRCEWRDWWWWRGLNQNCSDAKIIVERW